MNKKNHTDQYFSKRALDGSYGKLYTDTDYDRENICMRARRNHVIDYLSTIKHRKQLVLTDIGSGGSELGREFIDLGFDYFASDRSLAMLQNASSFSSKLFQADAACLPLKPGSVDIITILGVIEFIKDIKPVLSEIHQALKPEGLVLVSVTTKYHFENIVKFALMVPRQILRFFYYKITKKKPYKVKHYYRTKKQLVQKMKEQGFHVEQVIYYNPNFICFPLSRIPRLRRLSTKLTLKWEHKANRFFWRFFSTAVLVIGKKNGRFH